MKTACALLTFLLAATLGFQARAEMPTASSLLSFKMDFPTSLTSVVKTSGIGVYPLNFTLPALPTAYGSIGAAASIVRAANQNPELAMKVVSAIVQPRIAVGARYVPIRGLTLTTEIAYSPCAVEILPRSRGGAGALFNLSIGAHWL